MHTWEYEYYNSYYFTFACIIIVYSMLIYICGEEKTHYYSI